MALTKPIRDDKTPKTGTAAQGFISGAPDHKTQKVKPEYALHGKKRKLSPVIDPELVDEIDRVCEEKGGISRNAGISMAMREWVDRHDREKRERNGR